MNEQRARLLIRIPESLKAKLIKLAQRERRSLNKQIEFLLDQSIREEMKVGAGQPLPTGGEHLKRK